MLWMLLVYVAVANGYASTPTLAPSFHGATFATSDECQAAARKVTSYATPGTDDIAKSGLILVCAPASPQPEAAAPPQPTTVYVPVQQPLFPAYPPVPLAKQPNH